jgi:Cytochrome domain of cellobiose dehydrogenase
MVAPSGIQWLGLGQGEAMAGANMFLMYSSGSNNITLSPRLGRGEFQPNVNPAAQITLLEGTGISADGVMTANIRCDSCLTWSGGSMTPTSGKSNWIWSIKQGNAVNSADISAGLRQHDAYGGFTFDLAAGTSSDSANPFLQAATATQSTGPSQPSSSREGDADSDQPSSGSSGSSSGSSSGASSNTSVIRSSHGIIMAVVFLLLFPIGALMIYLPFGRKVLLAHAPIQVLAAALLIVGMILGVILGVRIDEYDGYHQIIGYIVVSCLLLFQPVLGFIQHLRHRKFGERTIFGHIHRWLGRILILLGVINGGLGLYTTGEIGSESVPTWSVIAYSVIAAVVCIIYIVIASSSGILRERKGRSREEGKERNGYANSNGHRNTR